MPRLPMQCVQLRAPRDTSTHPCGDALARSCMQCVQLRAPRDTREAGYQWPMVSRRRRSLHLA